MVNRQNSNNKIYDLEERTTLFAIEIIKLLKKLPRNPINDRLTGQEAGASGSIGANYREANDSLGKKDFKHKLKISRKEAKESIHWLRLLEVANPEFSKEFQIQLKENNEIKNILSTMIINCKD
ncbi:hypothetical protein A3F08_00205 [Candidatus Berkelbacteria bacterium RIFCSPHIGHO2_12_FULL_36_9]|uniref:Four helix bundle protein n=1 Tax=Candidatus Berkelbacteria bacterium RIFCSPHIGHO2_12_FULL_36_9 TaxID=1797469 RepID=A0A1F5EGM8_9BACT|nr:MAG: hypothetical protein A3F08_00205 [Candidatus Berkelbacteria bacterium RIFCSPHIGHO2_12_FULL_36_9]